MRRMKILGLAVLATLAMSGTASAHGPVLELYQELEGIEPPSLVTPGTEFDVYNLQPDVKFVGTSTLQCNEGGSGDLANLLFGSDLTNSKPKDKISITGVRIPACEIPHGFEEVEVSGLPATMTLTAGGEASLTGAVIFTFPDGCSYEGKKLTGTTSFDDVSLAGLLKRTKSSPKTCEQSLFVSGVTGYLETLHSGVYWEVYEVVS